ncbi:hypothetical protein ABVK25_012024 [Lepraria finkii]|uniref:Prenyltransferase alpha-alpha toroid domain-containing protein n=1 Tax=Lepraria finkii TaxID=1340010 RepID=A0ABR4AMB0_9LECA
MSTHAHTSPLSQSALTPTPDRSTFNKEQHIKYWLRCLKTHLPTAYTSNDSQRMTLAFFILSALDILGVLHTKATPIERKEYVDWILRCQHPGGGFRGFTGTMLGEGANGEECVWDSANLAATYFACAALMVLGEGMERVKRKECLEWVGGCRGKREFWGRELGREDRWRGAKI